MLMHVQVQAVEDDRRSLIDKLSAREAAGSSCMSEKLAQLEAQVAAQHAQLQDKRAHASRSCTSMSNMQQAVKKAASYNVLCSPID